MRQKTAFRFTTPERYLPVLVRADKRRKIPWAKSDTSQLEISLKTMLSSGLLRQPELTLASG
ncbi:hypothetical protein [Rhizobium sp. BK491]|uniref:hypothetical protein n=1 Tax=Rhizobium sp. BK491 TaxID=2587009 RepID=UPI00161DF839|nr:hypothetical protein [Rhizobium sp. BK491]MBB3571072.1 hypothetical protein [Rhizobium sp. BK491]